MDIKTPVPGSFKFLLAICGLGRAGHIHFKGVRLSHRCRLKYIVENVIDKADSTLTTYNMPEVTVVTGKEFDVVLSDPEVQAVIVATPTYTHEEFVIRALKAGKDVFCEKPIAEEIEKVALCYDEAERAGKRLFCAFQRRFDASMARIQAKVADGEMGKVHIIKTTSRDSPFPSIEYLKISGGMFHDTAIHDLDMVCWILGEEPDTVHAMAHSHTPAISNIDDVDTFVVTMKFPSGAISVIDASRHSTYGYDQRIEVLLAVCFCGGDISQTQMYSTLVVTFLGINFQSSNRFVKFQHLIMCVSGALMEYKN